jgi:hypothetical protein
MLERGESRREGLFISKIHAGPFISERLLSPAQPEDFPTIKM